jgi:hypothetical protein
MKSLLALAYSVAQPYIPRPRCHSRRIVSISPFLSGQGEIASHR